MHSSSLSLGRRRRATSAVARHFKRNTRVEHSAIERGGSKVASVTTPLAPRSKTEISLAEDEGVSIKYYTHFLLTAALSSGLSEFRGVVEVSRTCSRGDLKEARSMLAKSLECESKDIKVLRWSRLQ
jgi:hypothetical protein